MSISSSYMAKYAYFSLMLLYLYDAFYLVSIVCSTDETASTHEGSCHSTEEHKTETIRGTILVGGSN